MAYSINHYIPYPLDLHKAAVATGNGAEMELNAKYGTVVVRVLGITSATITFEAMRTNVVGDAYAAITGTNIATGAFASTATANGTFIFDVRGVWKFRARLGTYVSGTIYVHATATAQDANNGSVTIGGNLPSFANDLRGLASAKPAANTVSAGVTYWAVDTGVIEVSTGVAWVVV
jgi:hypothetical protein